MKRVVDPLRRHWLFLGLMPLLIIVMTWPAFRYVFDSSVFWLPTQRSDVYMLFWDAAYSNRILSGGADFFFTDLRFHPAGVSLAYHNHSLPHMFVLGALGLVLPWSSAFNLTSLLLIFVTASTAYVYLNHLFQPRWLAVFGALILGVSPHVLGRPSTPMQSFIATLPLSLYFLQRAVEEKRSRFAVAAGSLVGATAFVGLYVFVCLLITMALFILYFALSRWRDAAFWSKMTLLLAAAAALAALRIGPMLADSAGLSGALDKNQSIEVGADLMAYFVNDEQPITGPILMSVFGSEALEKDWRVTAYLGYLPLALVAFGLVRARNRRLLLPWLLVTLVFLILRLGSTLTINTVEFEAIRLPKHYLAQLLPPVFQPFWATDNFYSGAIFPFVVLTCYGMKALLALVPARRRLAIIAAAAAIVAFEYYQAPDPLVIPEAQLAFIDHLRAEADQDAINLINLPMGGPFSKIYDFYQSFEGYPQVEGRPTRAPPGAFDYIKGNLLLESWRRFHFAACLPAVRAEYLAALEQLETDGFSHIVLHHHMSASHRVAPSFAGLQPAYEDGFVRIYRLAQLRAACDNHSFAISAPFDHFGDLALSPALVADGGAAILSFHPAARLDDLTFRYLRSLFLYWKSLDHLYLREGQLQVQSDNVDLARILAGNRLIVLLYDPSQTDATSLRPLHEALAADFRACQRIVDTERAHAQYFVRADFPCALISAASEVEVAYDNGLRLLNLVKTYDGSSLNVAVWWADIPAARHSVSIQVFDGRGEKAAAQDFTVGVHPLAGYRMDLSSLRAGDYRLKLIVYSYETGASVSGAIVDSGTRFERELELGRIEVE